MLATFESDLLLVFAGSAFKTKNNLLGGLGLLVEDRFGLTSKPLLFSVITTLTLDVKGSLAGLVLGDLVGSVLAALGALAESVSGLGDVNL